MKLTEDINLEPNNRPSKQVIVLKTKMMPQDIMEVLNAKKTTLFGSALRRPKQEEITADSPHLFLEQVIFVSGNYDVEFNRDAEYTIKVNSDVKEVTIGDKKFQIADSSGMWKKMKRGVGMTKQDLSIRGTEKAWSSSEDCIYLDNHGLETNFPYSIDSESIENYAQRALDVNKEHIRKSQIQDKEAFSMLGQKFKDKSSREIEIIREDFTVTEFLEIFVPIYETKCYDKSRKVAIARIDAVTGTFL